MHFLVAALIAVTGAGPLAPVKFAKKPGWFSGVGAAHACPGVSADRCTRVSSWTATTRWRDCADCLPTKTVAALPPNGVAIQISLLREIPLTATETATWPLRIRRAEVVSPFEGLPPRVGAYRLFAQVKRYEVYVLVLFGRSTPTAAQLAAANAQLRAAHLP